MACNYPQIYNGVLCPCGKCAGCIRHFRQVWVTRAVLESFCHDPNKNVFLTLTYSDESLPADLSVSKRDFQLFLKRLRKRCGPLRYFACGEYGKRTFRPHYHAILYGFNGTEDDIRACWPQGFIFTGTVTPSSCAYVAKYIAKRYDIAWKEKLSTKGVSPEFSLCSRRPGLGFGFVEKIVDTLRLYSRRVVPTVMRIGGRFFVLGRYIRQKIAEMIGITDDEKQEKIKKLKEELLAVLNDYYHVKENPYAWYAKNFVAREYLESIARPDKDLVMRQRDNAFMGTL